MSKVKVHLKYEPKYDGLGIDIMENGGFLRYGPAVVERPNEAVAIEGHTFNLSEAACRELYIKLAEYFGYTTNDSRYLIETTAWQRKIIEKLMDKT